MSRICHDLSELKLVIRCTLVSTIEALTIEELWEKVIRVFEGRHRVQLKLFGYESVFDFLMSIPDVVQLEDPRNENSIVNLVSSELSRHMEVLVSSNIIRPPKKKNISLKDFMIPYRKQCALIRIFVELYPKGLTMEHFVSDILCIPMFKSISECAEVLLSNLEHIFKKEGLELIILQQEIVNKLKNVKEEGKFTAMEIYNIDEHSLENPNKDKEISNGLEYPLFNILEEPIKKNIEQLLDEEPGWISERKICNLYIEKFGSAFVHYRRWGFSRLSLMFSKLPELCYINFSDYEIQIISIKKYSPVVNEKEDLLEGINESGLVNISVKDKSEKEPEENDGVLKKFLRNDRFLEASLNDCFLDKGIQHFELQINELFNVKICRVNTHIIPTIICQSIDKYDEIMKLLTDMKKFYFINESKFMFDPAIMMVKHTYAFSLNDSWYRGVVTDISLNEVEIMNIDYGSIHNIPYDDVRMLHKEFSLLPAQAFSCHLFKIESIKEDELTKMIDKKCTIYVVSFNKYNNNANVKIKFMNSSDKYLNDEWIKNGVAELDSSSDEE